MLAEIVKRIYLDTPQKPLFHYTSLSGLMGLVESGALITSEIRYLNDAEELRHIEGWLRHDAGMRIYEKKVSDDVKTILNQFLDWLPGRLGSGPMIFIGSFTENGNLLSQWRGYCPKGKGVSVGFGPQKIIYAASQEGYSLGRCIYENETKKNLAAEILDTAVKLSLSQGPSEKSLPSNSFYHVFTYIEPDLLRIAALMKDMAFHEESEWRVVSEIVNNYVIAPIKYREGATMLIPYLEFPLCKNETEIC